MRSVPLNPRFYSFLSKLKVEKENIKPVSRGSRSRKGNFFLGLIGFTPLDKKDK